MSEEKQIYKSTEKRFNTMQKVQNSGTKIDNLIEIELIKSQINYTKPQFIIGDIEGMSDFVIPKYKIVVFCGGNNKDFKNVESNTTFWKENIKYNTEIDKLFNEELSQNSWKIFRFCERNIKNNAQKCIQSIKDYITEREQKVKKYKFTFIDLFSGIGGFRIPLDELGGECLGYSEINKNSIATYKFNFSSYSQDNDEFLGDVTTINKLNYDEIDLVVGGVPCQAWSVAGKMKGFEDPRGKLWEDAIRVVKLNQPKAFIFENVKGLSDPRNRANLELIIKSLTEIGYNVVPPQLLNSYDFGVPQNRDRIFIVGFRNDIKLDNSFSYPSPLNKKIILSDILESVNSKSVKKKKINIEHLHNGKIPLSRNRFQKIDEFNDFFIFCDTRNGHSTIHSWDIIRTTKKEKEICMAVLKNRRKKKYGPKDGNPLSFEDLSELVRSLKLLDLEKLVEKNILRKVEEKFEFTNSKNSSGINGIYRVYLPHSDIFSTLTATGTKDMIALTNIDGNTVEEYKTNFIKEIYRKGKYRPISSREAGKLQGFPDWFAVHEKEDIAKKQFGNAVSIPVIYNLAKEILKTGIFNHDSSRKRKNHPKIQNMV